MELSRAFFLKEFGEALVAGILTSVVLSFWSEWKTRRGARQVLQEQRCAVRFSDVLLSLLPARNRVHILGDLEEEYRTSYKRFPRFWYWGQVLVLVGSYWWAALRRVAGRDTIRKIIRK